MDWSQLLYGAVVEPLPDGVDRNTESQRMERKSSCNHTTQKEVVLFYLLLLTVLLKFLFPSHHYPKGSIFFFYLAVSWGVEALVADDDP